MDLATRSRSNGRGAHDDPWAVPLLAPRRNGPAERFATRMRGRHPAAVFFAAVLMGFALLAALSIALGLLVTDVVLHAGGVARSDESVVRSIVDERTSFLTDASEVGSTVGGAPLLPILVGLIAIVCALTRRWVIAGFAVFALTVESATYRVTSLAVPRERPQVPRLENLPADASYPSGHTAAAIAVYVGLVLLITSRFRDRRLRVAAWAVALTVPVFVALSRMYRGMHHPLDVGGGLVVGVGALLVLLFACRAANAAQAARRPSRQDRFSRSAETRSAQPVA
jgi:membrane-associated phospholipid phosphatase